MIHFHHWSPRGAHLSTAYVLHPRKALPLGVIVPGSLTCCLKCHTAGLGVNGLVRNCAYHGFTFFGLSYSSVSGMGNRDLSCVTAGYSVS